MSVETPSQKPQVAPTVEKDTVAKWLEKAAPDVLKAIPAEKRSKLFAVVASYQTSQIHVGPLPSPDDIEKYGRHITDGANRIMRMAETQAEHRQQLEKLMISSSLNQSRRGQIFGLIIGILGLLVGAAVAIKGHDWVGGTIAGATVVGLVAAFLNGKTAQHNSRITR